MKKIALLATGGTIASIHSPSGLVPGVSARELIDRVPGLSEAAEIAARDVFSLDSSNIQPEEWRVLARVAFDALSECDGAVITHGTDTMAYSAAALSFMLHAPRGPVVFTGSQLPLNHPLSDADSNLREAVEVARTAPPGVYVVFNHKIIHGARAVKLRTTSFDAFDSVNALPVGFLDAEGAHYRIDTMAARGEPALLDELDPRVFLLKLMPGTAPEIFDWIAESGMRGVVLEAFGLGGVNVLHEGLRGIQAALERGVSIVVTTQCLYDASDLGVYQVGKQLLALGVIQGRDMTSEAAMTKLMWAMGQGMDARRIKELFTRSLAGEITVED